MHASAVAVREAATVMLVRDAPDLEVFMVRRNASSVFVPGAYVFPGGQVDRADAATVIRDRCRGLDPLVADERLGVPGASRFWVAAVREAFEEAGVLLARRRADGSDVVTGDDARVALTGDRDRLRRAETDLVGVLDAHDAYLDLGALIPFGRWITPAPSPRRFDTWFFVAPAPSGHVYEHDDDEMIASEWTRPRDALDRARAGHIELIYPTIRSLLVLSRYPRAAELLHAARRRWESPSALRVMDPGQGWQLDLATEAEHRSDDLAAGFVVGMHPGSSRSASTTTVGG